MNMNASLDGLSPALRASEGRPVAGHDMHLVAVLDESRSQLIGTGPAGHVWRSEVLMQVNDFQRNTIQANSAWFSGVPPRVSSAVPHGRDRLSTPYPRSSGPHIESAEDSGSPQNPL